MAGSSGKQLQQLHSKVEDYTRGRFVADEVLPVAISTYIYNSKTQPDLNSQVLLVV